MISCDTNILFAACDADSVWHGKAREFLTLHGDDDRFCLSEQVLMELYCLLRNPSACRHPLHALEAMKIIHDFRSNRFWRVVDVVSGHGIMDRVWAAAKAEHFSFRRIFDARLAQTLLHHGVRELATRNLKDFRDSGFQRVWDPTASSTRMP